MAPAAEKERILNTSLVKPPVVIGLAGFGRIGETGHYPVLTMPEQQHFRLAGIADPAVRQKKIGETDVFPSIDGLLEIPTLQAVSIATPPGNHKALAISAIEAGKHVLLEKPPARTIADLRYMREAADANGVVLFTAYHSKYGGAVRFARDLFAQKQDEGTRVLGVGIHYDEHMLSHHKIDGTNWILKEGVYGDSGINGLSVVQAVIPDQFVNVKVTDARFFKPEGYHDPATGQPISFESETKAAVDFSYGTDGKNRGTLRQEWLAQGPERRIINFLASGPQEPLHEYTVDLIHKTVTAKHVTSVKQTLLFDAHAGDRTRVDRIEEYTGIYDDFAVIIDRGTSLVSETELALVEDAYRRFPTVHALPRDIYFPILL